MKINNDNIDIVVNNMYEYFKNKSNIATVDYPDNIIYKSEEWILYIFYSCLLDYGMNSKRYHENLINTYKKEPNIFNPKYVKNNYVDNKEELLKILKENVHPRYPKVALEKWINLSIILSNYNLLSKIKEFNSNEELVSFINSIKGYGQKTGGLLIRLLNDSNILNFSDELLYIPLDRHDIEISYLNNIISSKNLNKKEIKELSDAYIASGMKYSISASLIDQYLWNIGSSFCNHKRCDECPLKNTCIKK